MKKLKLFSLALMALFATNAWAGTETVTKSSNSWDGVSVNINHDECGNGSSDQKKDGDDNKVNYVKFRTNKNGNTLTLNVKSGYKVTGVSMRAYSNNKTSTIILSGVSIDGVAISPYAPIEFPGSDAGTTATYNNATLEAETSIVFSFDNSNVNPDDNDNKNSQIMAALTITYEIDCAAADATFSAESNSIEIGLGESSASTNLTFTTGDNTNDATFAVTKGGEATDKASVSAGVFTATAAGIYKVTATQENDGTHCEVIKEVTITVTDANGPDCSAGILFKMEALKVCTCSIASKTDYPLNDGADVSIEGGSLVLYNVNSSTKTIRTQNQSDLIQWKSETGDISFNITTDCDLAAGDTIKYTTNQSGQVLYINTTKATKPSSNNCDTIPADKKYYVVKEGDILEGRNSFSIWRGGSTTYIRTIEVVRPVPPCDAETPGSISKGTLSAGELTLNVSGIPSANNVWYWQTTEDGESKADAFDAETPYTVTAAGTYYLRSLYNNKCWGEASSIEVVAADFVDNYTVIYKDGETELDSETVAVGKHPKGITEPTKEFYEFATWQLSGEDVDLDNVTGAKDETVTLIVRWNALYLTESIDFEEAGNISGVASHNILASVAGEYDGGKADENWAYKGWKIKSAGATVRFLVPAYKYIQFKFGYLNVAGTVTISDDAIAKSVTGASKEEGNPLQYTTYYWKKDYDAVYTFTTGDKNAAVIKAIYMTDEEPTALDNTEDEVKAVKVLRDGQLFIEKNGHVYNVFGACIK